MVKERNLVTHHLISSARSWAHASVGVRPETEIKRLSSHHSLEGKHARAVGHYLPGVARSYGAHAYVILDIGGGGNGVDARRVGKALIL